MVKLVKIEKCKKCENHKEEICNISNSEISKNEMDGSKIWVICPLVDPEEKLYSQRYKICDYYKEKRIIHCCTGCDYFEEEEHECGYDLEKPKEVKFDGLIPSWCQLKDLKE